MCHLCISLGHILCCVVGVGDAFQGRLDKYLRSGIRKGVPSLFRDVATLYRDPAKLQLTERVITTYIQQLQTKKRFWDSDAEGMSLVLVNLRLERNNEDGFYLSR